MKRPSPTPLFRRLLSAAVLLAVATAWGQALDGEEPRWMRLRLTEASLGLEAEGTKENISFSDGSKSTYEHSFLTPLLGLRLNGSVYHPNFMTFDFAGEGGTGWGNEKVTSTGYSQTRNESADLLRYIANVNFLSAKPYNASFFAAQDHTYNNYDFFNTATVDSLRYGGHLAWTSKSFNLSADMGYRNQTASGLSGVSFVEDTYLNFIGINQREFGSTTLNYNYDNSGNQLNYGTLYQGVSHSINASDTETFGARKQISATTGIGYSQFDYPDQSTKNFNLNENVNVQLGPNMDGFANGLYNDTEAGPTTTSIFQGMAGVRHRLYDSLSSAFDVHGNYGTLSSQTSSGNNSRYGVGLREDYTKRLNNWGRLTLGGAVILDHEDYDSAGTVLTVINEAHVLSDTVPATLNNPRVIQATIVVTGPSGVPTYTAGVDYLIVQSGQLTMLYRNPTSLLLPNNSAVLVSYQSQSLFTSSFESLNGSVSVRLDLYNTFGIYGRLNTVDNNAPPQATVESLTDWVGGADVSWRWMRVGAEYEDYDSNFTQYRATRLFQTFSFQPSDATSLGINLNQIWYRYPDGRSQTQYQFMGIFNTQLTSWLSWNVEGGYYMNDVTGTQQNLAAARTGLNLAWGKITMRTGYQYNYELTGLDEKRDRNYFYLHLRRVF